MKYYDVAKILTTHGLDGEVKVALITDFPEQRFKAGSQLALKDNPEQTLTVKSGRPFKQFWLVSFKEINDIDQAMALKGKTLVVSEDKQQELPAGSYYYRDIMGCSVLDQKTKEIIGKITDIQSPGANDIWLVQEDNGHEFWLPYIPDVVKKIDVKDKKIYVEMMEGLRDEN